MAKTSLSEKGFTLIEVLVSVSIAAILILAVQQVFSTALSSWRIAIDEVQISKNFESLLNTLTEGDYEISGLRDAVEIHEATKTSLSFTPLWTDEFTYPSKDGEFSLSKKMRSGAPPPLIKIKFPGTTEFQTFPIFLKSSQSEKSKVEEESHREDTGLVPEQEKNHDLYSEGIVLTDSKTFTVGFPIPRGSLIRATYTPDSSSNRDVVIAYRWDPKNLSLERTYLGATKPMILPRESISITHVEFRYYDSIGHEIDLPSEPSNAQSEVPISGISAVGITMEFSGLETRKTMKTFAAIRAFGRGSSGILMREGSEIYLPDSASIRLLTLSNFAGLKNGDQLEIVIESPEEQKTLRMRFDFTAEGEVKLLKRYDIEYPLGKVVEKSAEIESLAQGINLLDLSQRGFYDYDDDEGIRDVVTFSGNQIKFRIRKMTFDGATLLIRP